MWGGAIYAKGASTWGIELVVSGVNVEIHSTTFESNTVIDYGIGVGGAIYINDGTLVIHDSTFDANTAGYVS